MLEFSDRYRPFVTYEKSDNGSFKNYVARMRRPDTYGTDVELSAFANVMSYDIWVYDGVKVTVRRAWDDPEF